MSGQINQPQLTPPLTPPVRLLLVVAFAVVLFLRMPDVLYGRLWAEEGKIFFARAAAMPWFSALLLPYGGYLNLVANAAPIIAWHTVPLEYAPWVTTGIGLIFQCCPAIILVCSRDEWLRPRWSLIAALLIIATPPMVSEVWLQSLHSQFHLALCCALILALDAPQKRLAWFGGVLLFLAPLCGPASSGLLPLFFARAMLERSRARLSQTLILAAGTLLQITFFYSHQAGRSYEIRPIILLCDVYIRQIVSPLAGWKAANLASTLLQARLASHLVPWVPVLVTISVFGVFVVALLRRRHAASVWLFLAACLMTFICYFGAFGTGIALLAVGAEGRYTFLPQVLAGLALLGVATGRRASDYWIARVIVGWLIFIGILYIGAFPPVMGPSWTVNWIIHGPNWRHQVALWHRDPHHPIGIWPRGWTMTLPSE